ncbi:MAG: hypothetical protein U1D55_07325 [Phycisphaerae bacterium]
MRQLPDAGLEADALAGLATSIRVDQRIEAIASAVHEQEDPGLTAPEAEREPPNLEDTGESDRHERDVINPFDLTAIKTPLRWARELPRALRPPVRYEIVGPGFEVKETYQQPCSEHAALRLLIAHAIAAHLRRCNVKLTNAGDWVHVPCIRGDRELVTLMESAAHALSAFAVSSAELRCSFGEIRGRIEELLKDYGWLKDFAIRLPSRDVIRVQAVLRPAFRSAKRPRLATCAAALRLGTQTPPPELIAGEPWSPDDWVKFRSNQRERALEASKAP